VNRQEKQRKLLELARGQGGFFTSSQAEECGFVRSNHHLFVKNKLWERERRGIFRIASEPPSEHEDKQVLSLFFRHRNGKPSGVFGLETAAAMHQMGDLMPAKIRILVAPGFRKRAPIPKQVEVIEVAEIVHEICQVQGISVTTPLRTIVDLIDQQSTEIEEIRRTFLAARSDGIITPHMLRDGKEWISKFINEKLKNWEQDDDW